MTGFEVKGKSVSAACYDTRRYSCCVYARSGHGVGVGLAAVCGAAYTAVGAFNAPQAVCRETFPAVRVSVLVEVENAVISAVCPVYSVCGGFYCRLHRVLNLAEFKLYGRADRVERHLRCVEIGRCDCGLQAAGEV